MVEHFHGKEGVVGSSPIPGFMKGPAEIQTRTILGLIAVALLVALFAPASVAGAAGPRIAAPANERFFAKPPVGVKVLTPRSARSLRAELEGRSVSKEFERVRPGVWRASFNGKGLRSGNNRLVVSTRLASGTREYDAVTFTVGKRSRGFLALTGPRTGSGELLARVRARTVPQQLIARLNGKRLRWPLGLAPGRRTALRLGADDGLRFGPNRLQVLARRGDGVFDVERRRVFVPRTAPLAGAGRDRRVAAGSRARLDGRSSRAARRGAKLSYRWKVVRKPRGAPARLRGSASARPRLLAGNPGTYRVRLRVLESLPGGRARSATDVATVTSVANLAPIGAPIETISYNGGNTEETADTAIRIGAKTYWLGSPKGNSIQAVILDRETLEPLYAESFPGTQADAEELNAKVKQYGKEALVVISNPSLLENSGVNSAFGPIVKSLGVSKAAVESIANERSGWSVVGVPGAKGSAYFGYGSSFDLEGAGDVRGNLTGYLQENLGSAGFSFIPAERVDFDTSIPGAGPLANTIQVGNSNLASAPLAACGTGGFQVEVLLAETLVPVSSATFTTNGCGPDADRAELERLSALLSTLTLAGGQAEGTKLVFLQSIGSPYDVGAAAAWNSVAEQLVRLGGTASVFAEARQSYALVGGLGVAGLPMTEASETLTKKPARITGMLQPNREDSFSPLLSSTSGTIPFELNSIAYRPAQAWPSSSSTEERAALAYAAEYLKLEAPRLGVACTVPPAKKPWLIVRAEYCNLRYETEWKAMGGELKNAPAPRGRGFSAETWERVTGQLATEFGTVQSVWTLVRNLQEAFGATGTSAEVNLKTIALEIEEAVAPPGKSEAAGWWLELLANIASTASYYSFGVDGEIVQKASGTLSGALFIAAQMIFGPQGAPEAEKFKLETDEFAVKLAERYLAASNGLGLIGELLVSDHGRLTAVSESGLLGISKKTMAKLKNVLGPGSRSWSYQQLLPTSFEAISLQANPLDPEEVNKPLPTDANEFVCFTPIRKGLDESFKPFHAPGNAQLRTNGPTEALGVLVIRGSPLPGGGVKAEPRSPKEGLLEPLFKSEAEIAGGLGLHAPWFWRSAFDYPSAATQNVQC